MDIKRTCPSFVLILLCIGIAFSFFPLRPALAASVPEALLRLSSGYAVFIDKHLQRVYVLQNRGGNVVMVFDAPCSTGKAPGEKMEQKDAKTPRGIFFATKFEQMRKPHPAYGTMVFHLDYPNLLDKRMGKNGSNIWIHGTNKSLQPFQSNGCVVMKNKDIEALSRYIYLGKTPVIIEESIKWIPIERPSKDREELERVMMWWSKAILDGDQNILNRLYYPESPSASSPRKVIVQKTRNLKDASGHFDFRPQDITICRLDDKAVMLFDQVLSVQNADSFQGSYVRLFLEKIDNRWLIVDNGAPQRRSREESVAAATPAGKKQAPATGPREASTAAAPKETAKTAPSKAKPAEVVKDQDIRLLVENWAKSWTSGNMEAYRACYAPSFRNRGMDLSRWVTYKKDLRKTSKNISVKIDNLKTSSEGQKATATFTQKYSASNIKSSRAKRLELVKIDGEWKIIRESMAH
ncbi:MAG: L,D-transpeptidase family protein [Deltaproteobacteria bacterium]|nr:L,D-transpeptidase family protein [Deltaproteobacteria bacterium]